MKVDDVTIDKVLNNKASAGGAGRVAEWFATEEGSRYPSERLENEPLRLTEEQALDWLDHPVPEERMRQRSMGEIRPQKRMTSYHRGLIAAIVLIPFPFLSLSLWFLADRIGVFSATECAELKVPRGEWMQVALQDGTVIQSNLDTHLRYPRQLGLFSRSVELRGEGYFVVAKEKNRPLIVDLGGIEVKVAGTKFSAKAYPAEQNVRVIPGEGGVLLEDLKHKECPLIPGQSVERNRKFGRCQIFEPEDMDQIFPWRFNNLNSYLTPPKGIIEAMERRYDIHFIVHDSTLSNNRPTLSTSKVDVDDTSRDLEVISWICFSQTEGGVFEILKKEQTD